MFFFGGHGKAGRTGNLHKGIKAHQIAQDQVHIHGTGHVAAADAAGIRPGAAGGADALGQGVHLVHPAREVAARKGIGKAHGGFVGVAGQHGVHGFAVGKGLVGVHIGVVGVINVIRDGKGHLEGVVQMVGIVGQQQGNGHVLCQTTGGYLLCAVLIIDDDIGIGVDDIGTLCLHLIDRGGIEHSPGGQHKAAEQDSERQNQRKNTFHVDNSFKKR